MRSPLVVFLALGLGGSSLAAQTVDSSKAIAGWRDSIAQWPIDSVRAQVDRTGAPKSPLDRLHSGWLLLTLTGMTDTAGLAARAMNEFYEVTVRRPRWVEGWYGLGMAKVALLSAGAREIRSPHQTAGTGWAQGAANAFLQAQRVDPPFLPAAIALAKLTPQLRDRSSAREIERRLDQAVAADGTDPSLWLLVADAATARGDDASAVAALQKAGALPGAPAGTILLALARAHFALGDTAAAADEYYRGAAIPDSEARTSYRYDIALVADSVELARYDSVGADRRADWIRGFWAKRERASGRPEGSRLVEHERRYRYARAHYAAIPRQYRQNGFDEPYRGGPAEFDDRGAIYVRHGAPDQTATYIDPDVQQNESWLYYRAEGNLVFHFMQGMERGWGLGGWHLIASPFNIPGAVAHLSGILDSRMPLDPRFGTLALRFEADSMILESYKKLAGMGLGPSQTALGWLGQRDFAERATIETMDREGRAAIDWATHTDSDPLRFDRTLEPLVQVFGAGDPTRGTGRLLIVASLPSRPALPYDSLPGGGAGYPIFLRVTAGDDSGHTTLDVDSLIRLRTAHPLAAGEYLTLVRSYAIPATGDQHVRVIVSDSARTLGAVRVANGVPVPDLADPVLTISDLIVGRNGSGVDWAPPSGPRVPLNPLNAWTPRSDLELTFEVGGLEPSQPFHARVSVGDITADTTRPPRTAVAFDQVASGARTRVTQTLGLESLKPGRYLISVVITAGDRTVRRDRRITVVR